LRRKTAAVEARHPEIALARDAVDRHRTAHAIGCAPVINLALIERAPAKREQDRITATGLRKVVHRLELGPVHHIAH